MSRVADPYDRLLGGAAPEPDAAAAAPPQNPLSRFMADPAGEFARDRVESGDDPEDVARQVARYFPGADADKARGAAMAHAARQKYAGSEEDTLRYLARRSVPGLSAGFALGEHLKTNIARRRVSEGTATQEDYDTIAQAERLAEIDRQRTPLQQGVSAVARLPAVLGEAYAAGPAVSALGRAVGLGARAAPAAAGGAAELEAAAAAARAAGATVEGGVAPAATTALGRFGRAAVASGAQQAAAAPLMPSLYVENATRRAEANGGAWYEARNLGVAGAHAVVTAAVLGHVQKLTAGLPGGLAGRVAAGAPAGILEQQGADAAVSFLEENLVPEAYQTKTRYGIVGKLLRGESGDAAKEAAIQAVTFGFFAALHPGKNRPPEPDLPEYDATKREQPRLGPAAPAGQKALPEGWYPGEPGPRFPREVITSFADALNDYSKRGVGADRAGREMSQLGYLFKLATEENPNLSSQQARDLVDKYFGKKPYTDAFRKFAYAVTDHAFPDAADAEVTYSGTAGRPPSGAPFAPRLGDRRLALPPGPEPAPPAEPPPPVAVRPQPTAPEARPAEVAPAAAGIPPTPEIAQDASGSPISARAGEVPTPTPDRPAGATLGTPAEHAEAVRQAQADAEGGKQAVYVSLDVDNMAGLVKAGGPEKAHAHVADMLDIYRDELSKVGEARLFRSGADPRADEHAAVVSGADKAAVNAALDRAAARVRKLNEDTGAALVPHEKAGRPPGTGLTAAAETFRPGKRTVAEAEADVETRKAQPGRPRQESQRVGVGETRRRPPEPPVAAEPQGVPPGPVRYPEFFEAGGRPGPPTLTGEEGPRSFGRKKGTQVLIDDQLRETRSERDAAAREAERLAGQQAPARRPPPRPRSLAGEIRRGGGLDPRSIEAHGLSVADLRERLPAGLIRKGGRALEDVIPELQRSGDLPTGEQLAEAGVHAHDALMDRLAERRPLADQPAATRRRLEEAAHARHAREQQAAGTAAQERALAEFLGPEPAPSGEVVPFDLEKRIDEAGMPAGQADALKQFWLGSSREAAAKLGVSHETVLRRAKAAAGKLGYGSLDEFMEAARREGVGRTGLAAAKAEAGHPAARRGRPGVAQKNVKGTELRGGIPFAQDLWNYAVNLTKWLGQFRYAVPRVPLSIDRQRILPRWGKYADWKAAFNTPEGLGRFPVLARVFDPRGVAWDMVDQAVIARQSGVEVGKNVAALWAASQQLAKRAFQFLPDGTFRLANNTRGHLADVMEAEMRRPGSQPLTAGQRSWLNGVYKPLLDDFRALMRDEGVGFYLDAQGNPVHFDEHYFPRPAVGKKGKPAPSGPGQPPGGPSSPGAKSFFQKERAYASEKEGRDAGIVYDDDIVSRVAKMIAGGYRAVADRRLATDPALGGRPLADLVWLETKAVHVGPAFAGKVYPVAVAAKLETHFAQARNPLIAAAEKASGFAKAFLTGMDWGVPFNQGLPLLLSRPDLWAKSYFQHWKALFDPATMAKYLLKPGNLDAAKEFVQLGGTLGHLSDFAAGLEHGAPATKVPVLGKMLEISGRQFGAFMDAAKLELWKAWKDVAPPEQMKSVVESIENVTLMGRMEMTGLPPWRMLAERLLLLAPAYYRSGAGLVTTAFQRGVAGNLARNTLGKFMGGLTLLAYGGMKYVAGLSDDEIRDRFDPSKGKFLKVPITLSDGSKLEVGFGNVLISFARLGGNLYSSWKGDSPVDVGSEGNPVLRWLRGHSGTIPRFFIDTFAGQDYQGKSTGVTESALKAAEPIAAQNLLHGDGAIFEKGFTDPQWPKNANVADAVSSVVGLAGWPGSRFDEEKARLDAAAQQKYQKAFADLSFNDKARVVEAVERTAPVRPPATPEETKRAEQVQVMRQRKVTELVTAATREKAQAVGLPLLPPFEAFVTIAGNRVPLTKDQQDRLLQLTAEEYDRFASLHWKADTGASMPPRERLKRFEALLADARGRAKERLITGR